MTGLPDAVVLAPLLAISLAGSPEDATRPSVRAGVLDGALVLDGHLDERAWTTAETIDRFTQTEPAEGRPATDRTSVRVLAGEKAIVIGIVCDDPDPSGIVSFSVSRDPSLASEDHVRIVLGPFFDGRSGYVFAVNPSGARYDGLVNPGGESDNPQWDGIWDAATARTASGWSAEIWIPVLTLSFRPEVRQWHFNVQRRIQRLLETDRWAFPARQYQLTQTSRAGVLTGLPEFKLGLGLSVRPGITTGGGVPAAGAAAEAELEPTLDVMQRLGGDVLASVTVNTDFAETEVDTRRTNLTRFPLFFPEKRTFFLEGDDIFAFGLGLANDLRPYFSRRIGLVEGREVPILAGGKINGRKGGTNFGALVVGTDAEPGLVGSKTAMAAGRVKQNLWRESWAGAILTAGDPLGRSGSWMAGADFTYATSHFRGNKNFLVGVWALATGREDLGGDASAHGFKVDYPNDLWDMAIIYKRIGKDFDPSLGFVPRRAVRLHTASVRYVPRFDRGPIQQMSHQLTSLVATDLAGRWESYRVTIMPVNWRFRSGDRVELKVEPTGERLVAPFGIADEVAIPAGVYQWRRYGVEVETARKRRFSSQIGWFSGGFYDGELNQIALTGAWNPVPLLTVELTGERNVGRLAEGRFTQTLAGSRVRVNVSPDFSISSYIQYDTVSDSLGVNTRLRWTFSPAGDLFVVYNHNLRETLDRWRLDSNQLLVKLQYALRY